jgi:PIN domain nuclease of toxin-antitoxin system
MNLLLDTHTLVWWLNNNPKLSNPARLAMISADNRFFVSAATAWELATKVRRGRWPDAARFVSDFRPLLEAEQFDQLDITVKHGLAAGGLLGDYNDPFDRMLAAQAIIENMSVVTVDPAIQALGAPTVW